MENTAGREHLVAEFAKVVRRYDEWFNASPSARDVLEIHQLLGELQLRLLAMPESDSDDDYINVEDDVDLTEWRKRTEHFPVDGYWKVFDVFAEDEEPVFCAIADDLADIHANLREGLHFFEIGQMEEAIWRWQFTYFSHWGRHLTGAQTALHQFFADQGGINNES